MPLYDVVCVNGHQRAVYYAKSQDKRCRTHVCPACGHSQGFVLSVGQGLTHMSEKSPQTFHNLGHDPVTVTSQAAYNRILKERNLAWAGARRGEPNCWS